VADRDFTLLPVGTVVIQSENCVTFEFPSEDDAIAFAEFIHSWVRGEIELEATDNQASY